MKIKLINQEQYNELLQINNDHDVLTFQNNGYEYIDQSKFTEKNKKAFDRIESILKEHIVGFDRFNNFCMSKNDEIRLRFQYNYGAEDDSRYFQGVGYILLRELLNGFDE